MNLSTWRKPIACMSGTFNTFPKVQYIGINLKFTNIAQMSKKRKGNHCLLYRTWAIDILPYPCKLLCSVALECL